MTHPIEAAGSTAERDLVELFIRSKDEGAFRKLFRMFTPQMAQLALRLTGNNSEDCKEAVQEMWIRVARNLHRFRWESSLRTWITGVLINCCREIRRARGNEQLLAEGPEDGLEVSESGLNRVLDSIDLEEAFAKLPAVSREIILLHDVEGYTHEETALLLGIALGTSKSALHRARARLRALLSPNHET